LLWLLIRKRRIGATMVIRRALGTSRKAVCSHECRTAPRQDECAEEDGAWLVPRVARCRNIPFRGGVRSRRVPTGPDLPRFLEENRESGPRKARQLIVLGFMRPDRSRPSVRLPAGIGSSACLVDQRAAIGLVSGSSYSLFPVRPVRLIGPPRVECSRIVADRRSSSGSSCLPPTRG
jgi:hypothetical protein